MKKSLVRTIIYSSIVGAILIGGFVCYGISRASASRFEDKRLEIVTAEAERAKTVDPVKIAEYDAIIEAGNKETDKISMSYRITSIASYALTIGGLVAFGVCLAISDKIKKKEEDAAGRD